MGSLCAPLRVRILVLLFALAAGAPWPLHAESLPRIQFPAVRRELQNQPAGNDDGRVGLAVPLVSVLTGWMRPHANRSLAMVRAAACPGSVPNGPKPWDNLRDPEWRAQHVELNDQWIYQSFDLDAPRHGNHP
jgi:hypothetical protein